MENTASQSIASDPSSPNSDAETVRVASNLIAHFEQYLQVARWDVNAFRNGFGSDTEGAAQTTVYQGEQTSKADALANLAVRVPKFLTTVEWQLTPSVYAKLGVNTKAALASLAYNYGRVPQNVVVAVLNNSTKVSDAIRSLGSDNHGINSWRRDGEAAVVALDGGQY